MTPGGHAHGDGVPHSENWFSSAPSTNFSALFHFMPFITIWHRPSLVSYRLNHMPSARFAANGAWLAIQVMAHNLARWTARIGLGERTVITKTLRRRAFALVGRITRSARRLTLHLPRRWPWETQFSRALARLQAILFPA